MWGLILLLSFAGVLLFAERELEGGLSAFAGQAAALPGTEAERQASTRGLDHTEVFPLLMFAVGGMMLFPAANDLLTLFVGARGALAAALPALRPGAPPPAAEPGGGAEVLPARRLLLRLLHLRHRARLRLCRDDGFDGIDEAISNNTGNRTLLLIGIGLVSVGLLFKIGAAPFQAWTPDVYQGAPTAVTGFMAAATKVAAFGALMRLYYVAFGSERWTWQPMLWVIAILTMVVGALLAIAQSDIKRMLAYSSVAHTGFLLTGVLGVQSAGDLADGEISALQAVLFYLVTYGFMTLGAFAVVSMVRDAGGEVTHLSRWAGLGREAPFVAGVFALFLLGMAGIPLTSGFTGKWAVFAAAVSAGAWPVVVVAVLASALAAFFYLRVIVLMYFTAPVGDGPSVTMPALLTSATIALGVATTLSWASCPARCWTWPVMRENSSGERIRRPGLALPVLDEALAERLTARMAEVEEALQGTSGAGPTSSPKPPGTCSRPAASGSGRCWCCWPPRPGRTPAPTRWSPPPVWSS